MTYFQPHPTWSLISIGQRNLSCCCCDTNHKTIAWIHEMHAFAPHAPCLCSRLQPPLLCQCGFLMFPESPSSNSSFRNFMRRPRLSHGYHKPKKPKPRKMCNYKPIHKEVEIVYSLVFSLYGVLGLAAHFSCSPCATKCLKVLKFQIGLTQSVGGGGPWPITTSTTHTQISVGFNENL